MGQSLLPYLDVFAAQLGSALTPRDEGAQRVPVYLRRILTMLSLEASVLPAMRQQALREFNGLLDALAAELHGVDGAMPLVPRLMHSIRVDPDYASAKEHLQSAVRLLAGRDSDGARRLETQIAGIDRTLMDSFYDAVTAKDAQVPEPSAQPPEALNTDKKRALRDWLRARFAEETSLEIGRVKEIVGGGSKQTLIIALENTRKLPPEVVLRSDRAEGVVASTVTDEYRLIDAVHRAGVRAPQPLAMETDRGVLGAPFIVVSRIVGHNVGDWFEVFEPSRKFAESLAETLARLHSIQPQGAGDHLPGAATGIPERVAAELSSYETNWRASGETSLLLEQALAWCRRHLRDADGRRAIVHADVGCHNMLGHDGDLTALLDWETAVIGNPAHDIAYIKSTVEQMMPWEEFLAAYEKAGGRRPSEREMRFYLVMVGIFRMHFIFMTRTFIATGFSNVLVHAYGALRIGLFAEHTLHRALCEALQQGAPD